MVHRARRRPPERGQPDRHAAGGRRGPGRQSTRPARACRPSGAVPTSGSTGRRTRRATCTRSPTCASAPTPAGTGANGWDHPVSWCRDYDGGRSFYTGMGGTAASFAETDFRNHLRGALRWTTGIVRGDCKATIDANYTAERLTAPNNFTGSRREPAQPDRRAARPEIDRKGRVFYIGRAAGPPGPDRRLERPERLARLGHRPRLRPEQAGRPARDPHGHARRLRQQGRRRRADQERGGPARHRARPGLRRPTAGSTCTTRRTSQSTASTHIGTRRVSRFTFDVATGKLDLASEKGMLEWPVPDPQLLPRGRRHGLRQGGNLYIAHRRQQLLRARQRRLLRQQLAAVPGD